MSAYTESSFRILEGLEPVKLRPGQFTRTDSPLHILQEVLDNSVDEALAGFAKNISLTLLPENAVRVEDDGRGIPVGKHPEKGIPVVQAAFTVLYSGGKFDKATGEGAYSFSGGLHGVGVSVTNALSESLIAEVKRDGKHYRIGFTNGDVTSPLKKIGLAETTGTAITLRPNPKYFDTAEFPVKELRALLQTKAVLLPGLTVRFIDARSDNSTVETFHYDKGLAGYLTEIAGDDLLVPIVSAQGYADKNDETFADGEGAEWAFSFYERGDGNGRSFVNLIPTPDHGTHVAGLRSAVFNAMRNFIEHHGMLPKGVRLTADDAFKVVKFVLSARMLDPSFDNQTKDRLNSRDGLKLVERMVQPRLEGWLSLNAAAAKTVADIIIRHAMARQRAATKNERRRSSSVVMLPGKLADCESASQEETELFLVEGDSAGGSAKMARDKNFQAILPLRGKSLNVWEKTADEALANEEIHDIATALGVAPHSLSDTLDLNKLRYGKVAILADADVDGFHIQTLLLTLFFRHFPQLVERGHIYVARPPLYRLDVESSSKRRPAKKLYVMDESELRTQEDRLRQEGYSKWRVGRFKGLGEMDPPELWETTLAPDTRRLLRVSPLGDSRGEALDAFTNLMARNQASWRREWMERRGNEIDSY